MMWPKEVDHNGRYTDTRWHEVTSDALANGVKTTRPAGSGPRQYPSGYWLRVIETLPDGSRKKRVIDYGYIRQAGIGAPILRCPEPDCNVSYTNRNTVMKHHRKHHPDSRRSWNGHPTMNPKILDSPAEHEDDSTLSQSVNTRVDSDQAPPNSSASRRGSFQAHTNATRALRRHGSNISDLQMPRASPIADSITAELPGFTRFPELMEYILNKPLPAPSSPALIQSPSALPPATLTAPQSTTDSFVPISSQSTAPVYQQNVIPPGAILSEWHPGPFNPTELWRHAIPRPWPPRPHALVDYAGYLAVLEEQGFWDPRLHLFTPWSQWKDHWPDMVAEGYHRQGLSHLGQGRMAQGPPRIPADELVQTEIRKLNYNLGTSLGETELPMLRRIGVHLGLPVYTRASYQGPLFDGSRHRNGNEDSLLRQG